MDLDWIRAVSRLGFFVCGLVLVALQAGCARPGPRELAAAADTEYRTQAFTWLVEHEPAVVVAWRVPVARLTSLIPEATVTPARTDAPCSEAARAHAALFVIAPRSDRMLRARAEDCGFALYRDDGALVIAPR